MSATPPDGAEYAGRVLSNGGPASWPPVRTVTADIGADAVKIGMLASAAIVKPGGLFKKQRDKNSIGSCHVAKAAMRLAATAVGAELRRWLIVTPNAPEEQRNKGGKYR